MLNYLPAFSGKSILLLQFPLGNVTDRLTLASDFSYSHSLFCSFVLFETGSLYYIALDVLELHM